MMQKSKVATGVSWVALSNVVKQILQIGSLVFFARFLSTDDFGVYSIIMIFIGFLGMFVDFGASQFIVHTKDPSKKLLSTIFYFNIIVGVLVMKLMRWLSN